MFCARKSIGTALAAIYLLFSPSVAGAAAGGIRVAPADGPLPIARPATSDRRPDMLPDGVLVRGHGDIRAAWLTGPTRRYGHGVLGDAIEASGMTVEMAGGTVLSLVLGPDAVFEDRYPRLVDMDGDGRTEALVVKSYLAKGAALALAAVRGGRLSLIAESEPIGLPNRWLNPVGAADFDGDGRIETAHVETPHIGGTLVLSRLAGRRLESVYRLDGFSNHRIGSRELGMSAILDVDGDGIADIVLPDRSRTVLRAVTVAGGRFRELGRAELGGEIASGLHVFEKRTGKRIALRLSSGKIIQLIFSLDQENK